MHVRELMTTPVVSIGPEASLKDVAAIFVERRISGPPVYDMENRVLGVISEGDIVKGDRLVGIVTRTDLARAFMRSDEEIERALRDDVLTRTLWLDADSVEIEVKRGAVKLAGMLPTRRDAVLFERLAGRVLGVVAVAREVTWKIDDTSRKEGHTTERRVR